MNKKELKKLRTLRATPKMMAMARNDKKEKRKITTYYGYTYEKVAYEYALFLRCQTLKGYLKVAIFLPEMMRCGSNMPVYEIFLHRDAGQYLTWDAREQRWLTAMIDNLPLDWYGGHHTKLWMNPEGISTVKQYLGVKTGGYEGIRQWQQKIHTEQVEARYKRQTDPWDADQALVPALPKDWTDWLRTKAVREWFVFYKTGAQEGYCTYCDKQVPIDSAKHNKKTICTCCGNNVTYKNTNRMKYLHTGTFRAYLPQRIKAGVVIRSFRVQIGFRGDGGWKPVFHDNEVRRAFYDDRGKHRASYIYEWFRNRELRWCKTDSMFTDWGKGPEGATYGRTLPELYRRELKYTGLAEYRKRGYASSPEWYLAVWNLYPQIELLLKAALPKLLLDCIACTHYLSEAIDPWISGPLVKKMGIDESRLKRLRFSGGGMDTLRWLQHEKKTQQQLPDTVIAWLVDNQFIPAHFDFIRNKMSDLQVYNYLQKQMEQYCVDARRVMTWWRDTLSMQAREGKDLSDPYFYRPARLKKRHDELVLKSAMADLKATAEKSKQKFPQVEPVLQQIRDIYSYAGDKYMVVVPETILDIVMEGRALAHCVGTSERYMERMESRESYILFLRKTEAPDESYYTLEVEPDGTVRQKRTTGDDQLPDIEDATGFLREWQKEIATRLTDTERDLAQKSKELRLEGFEQMRRDHVVIRTGDLRGRMLVDVLMADLMENKEVKTA